MYLDQGALMHSLDNLFKFLDLNSVLPLHILLYLISKQLLPTELLNDPLRVFIGQLLGKPDKRTHSMQLA